jgi:hypothetical protein
MKDPQKKLVILVIVVAASTAIGAAIGRYLGLPFLGGGLGAAIGVWLGDWLGTWMVEKPVEVWETTKHDLDALNSYTEGKMHRYTLLFAVNGGAFTVGQFLLGDTGREYQRVLPMAYLAQGAIVFTAIMTVDIWLFGQMMREKFVGNGAFTPAGKILLLLISFLVIAAWLVVLRHESSTGG